MANIGMPLLAIEPVTWSQVKMCHLWKKANKTIEGMADKKFREAVLKSHNEYRGHHQSLPLLHNMDLSAIAQQWAEHLAMTNTFSHSRNYYKGEKLGENIAMKWSSVPDAYMGEEVTDQWYAEVKMHTFGGEPHILNSGHFTQVVWRDSKEIGVGKAQTKDGKIIVVANYRPAGNIIGMVSENVLPPINCKEKQPEKEMMTRGSSWNSGALLKNPFEDSRLDTLCPTEGSSTRSTKSEMRSVRTYTVSEGVGSRMVTKTVTEETFISADGEEKVKRKVEVTEGNNDANTGHPFSHFEDKCCTSRSKFRSSSPRPKTKDCSKSSSSSDSSHERKPKTHEKVGNFIDDVIQAHNTSRKKHGVCKLKESKVLSTYAQRWAEHLAFSGEFSHSSCLLKGDRLGENIACKWSSGGVDYTGEEVSDQWYSEISKHDYRSERSMLSGHFTQMVWKSSKEIGVGKAKGQSGKIIVVANYKPAGNIIGQYSENVFPPLK